MVREFGCEPFERFVRSYRAHPAGRAHDLVIAAKQFEEPGQFAPWAELLKGVDHRVIWVPDEGFDLGTYREVIKATGYGAYCFLNSRSEILADNWLAALTDPLDRPTRTIVAASGSFESLSSGALGHLSGWPGPLHRLRQWLGFLKLLPWYPPFPNPHLRTNAFAARRETLLEMDWPDTSTKQRAWQFESGWESVTRQVRGLGGEALVADRQGTTFPVAKWADSATFWQGDQAGLIVGDRQTRMYHEGTPERRAQLARLAWRDPAR